MQDHIDRVIATVCRRYGITVESLLAFSSFGGKRLSVRHKTTPYAAARLDVVRLLRSTVTNTNEVHASIGSEMQPISYPAVARLLGGLNHSTLVKAVNDHVRRGEPEVLSWAKYLEDWPGA